MSPLKKGKTMVDDGADSIKTDRISNLPVDVLCHILSFLPTKNAVGTCILSTRWKNLFTLIPQLKLHLDDSSLLHPESNSNTNLISFTNFVNKLLNVTLRDVSSVHSLHLICRRFNEGQEIGNWISAALHLNVKSLSLWVHHLNNSNFLFDSLFGCNIVSLDLNLDLADESDELRFSLPNLNVLSVQYMRSNVVNAVLASCPSLEYLVVYNCICCHGEKFVICIPSLKSLKFINGIYGLNGEIKIDAPQLEYLNYGGILANRFSIEKLKSLKVANFNIDDTIVKYPFIPHVPTIELLNACSDAERMQFSDTFMRMLYRWHRPLPLFPKLFVTHVNYMDPYWWTMLPIILDSAPKLRMMFFKKGFDERYYNYFKASLEEPMYICLHICSESGYFFKIGGRFEN